MIIVNHIIKQICCCFCPNKIELFSINICKGWDSKADEGIKKRGKRMRREEKKEEGKGRE